MKPLSITSQIGLNSRCALRAADMVIREFGLNVSIPRRDTAAGFIDSETHLLELLAMLYKVLPYVESELSSGAYDKGHPEELLAEYRALLAKVEGK